MKRRIFLIIIVLCGVILCFSGVFLFLHSAFHGSEVQLPFQGNYLSYHDGFYTEGEGDVFRYYNQEKKFIGEYPLISSLQKEDGSYDYSSLHFTSSLAPFTDISNLVGVIDAEGNEVLPAQYESVTILDSNLFLVSSAMNYAFLDRAGNQVGASSFQTVEEVGTAFLVSVDGLYGIVGHDGNYLLEPTYQIILPLVDGDNVFFQASNGADNQYFLLQDGVLTSCSPLSFKNVIAFSDNILYYTDLEGKIHLYDTRKEEDRSLTGSYVALKPFESGLALVVNEDGLAGYINEEEEMVIPYAYPSTQAGDFTSDGLAVVGNNGYFGVIDTNEEEVLPLEYLGIQILDTDHFLVLDQNNVIKLLNKAKKNLLTDSYLSVDLVEDAPYLLVSKGKMVGLIDYEGKVLLKPEYQQIKVEEGSLFYQKENVWYQREL